MWPGVVARGILMHLKDRRDLEFTPGRWSIRWRHSRKRESSPTRASPIDPARASPVSSWAQRGLQLLTPESNGAVSAGGIHTLGACPGSIRNFVAVNSALEWT